MDLLGERGGVGDVARQPVPHIQVRRGHVAGPAGWLQHLQAVPLAVPGHLPAHLVAGHRAGGLLHRCLVETADLDLEADLAPGAGLLAVHLEQPGLGHVEDDLERRPGRAGPADP